MALDVDLPSHFRFATPVPPEDFEDEGAIILRLQPVNFVDIGSNQRALACGAIRILLLKKCGDRFRESTECRTRDD